MGMFEKDKQYGLMLTETLPQGEQFILHAARVADDTVDTKFGPSEQAVLTVSTLSQPDREFDVTTLASAVVGKVKEQEPGDLPAIVLWAKVNTKAQENVTVLRFVSPWQGHSSATRTTSREQTPGTDAPDF